MRRSLQGVLSAAAVLLASVGLVSCAGQSGAETRAASGAAEPESSTAEDRDSAKGAAEGAAPPAFEVSGTRVEGTEGLEGAPVLRAGSYADSAPRIGVAKHYTIRRELASSTLFVGVSSRPYGPSRDDELEVQLWTFSGTPCGQASNRDYDTGRQNSLVTVAVHSIPRDPADRAACRDAKELHLVVEPAYGDSTLAGAPQEIVVIEEPATSRSGDLPPASTDTAGWGSPMPVEKRTPASPGRSFAGSQRLRPGAFRAVIRPGEMQLYRVRLRWGQRLRVEARVDRPGTELARRLDLDQEMDLRLIAPTRGEAGVPDDALPGEPVAVVRRDGPTRLVHMTHDVRYRNRDVRSDPSVANTTLAGDYFVALTLAEDSDAGTDDGDYVLPYTLDIAVDDAIDGTAPEYVDGEQAAGPVTLPVPPPVDEGPDLRELAATVLLALGLVLVLIGGSVLLAVRRLRPVVEARSTGASG